MDGAGSFGGGVAGNSSGERKLFEQLLQALFVLRDVGIELAVGALEVGVGDQSGAAVAGAGQIDDIEIVVLDETIEMGVDEVETGGGSKMSQQTRLDVLDLQRLAEQRIGVEINLAYGKIVGGAPIGVDLAQFFGGEGLGGNAKLRGGYCGWGSHRDFLSISIACCFLF